LPGKSVPKREFGNETEREFGNETEREFGEADGFSRHYEPAKYLFPGRRNVELAMIGLGKMGANMARRLLAAGHRIAAYDLREAAVLEVKAAGAEALSDLADLKSRLSPPRVAWVMVPSGDPTEQTVKALLDILEPGDIIIDGGNSNYNDSVRRAGLARDRGLYFVDVGTSGGIWGLEDGYSLMIGGDRAAVEQIRPIFESLAPAPDKGWGHVGPPGAGHFVKMIHNGIEYGLMQAYAEGFELIDHKTEFGLDLAQIAQIWRHGSVIRSWLLDLTAAALVENPSLEGIAAYVPDSGEGRWTVVEAIQLNCSIPVITLALQRRFRSREAAPFADRLLAVMRQQFGGHTVKQKDGGATDETAA
jgi:6-phosphogluconate dehydrogenase